MDLRNKAMKELYESLNDNFVGFDNTDRIHLKHIITDWCNKWFAQLNCAQAFESKEILKMNCRKHLRGDVDRYMRRQIGEAIGRNDSLFVTKVINTVVYEHRQLTMYCLRNPEEELVK